ncbi:trypsin [Purpureocillium lavendulum]|uniref:Trypsin n=1 Tax=Purpureocillium lavendulum TaxID=1247861 RepID=A0AB34FMC9_9HYPO|nr:trypsin [Purpureocillium lavendulum]
MVSTIFALGIALVIPAVAAAPSPPPVAALKAPENIVGGTPARAGEFPYIVSLSRRGRGHFCGGSLLNENTVVTAAHCVVEADAGSTLVRAGSLRASGGGVQVGAASFIVHPNYRGSPEGGSDIAIIKLAQPIRAGGNIAYATLPAAGSDLRGGTLVEVAGWGATTRQGTMPSDVLLKVEVPAVERTSCNRAWNGRVDRTMVCAGEVNGGEDSCYGDSGGPLVDARSRVLVGTVSFGKPCAQPNSPTIYGNVGALLGFVKGNM